MQYQQVLRQEDGSINSGVILRIEDDGTKSSVPNDPMNSDWDVYQAWLAAGNAPLPPGGP